VIDEVRERLIELPLCELCDEAGVLERKMGVEDDDGGTLGEDSGVLPLDSGVVAAHEPQLHC